MADTGKFSVDIPQATNLRSELSAQTLIVSEESQKAQNVMENSNTDDPIMKTIGRIGQMYGQFSTGMKTFQQKADSELDKSIQLYSRTLEESNRLMEEAQAKYREF